MIKILQINVINKTSSTGRTTMELGLAIEKAGMKSEIAVAEGSGEDNVYVIGSKFEKKMHAFLSRILGIQGYFSYFGTKKLLRYMDKVKPDIVHLRNLHGNYLNLNQVFKYLQKKDISTIITLHDCWFYTGKCCHYSTIGCRKWVDGSCNACPKLHDDNVSWFFDRTNKMIKDKKKYIGGIRNLAVVGVSKWITEEARNSYVFSDIENIITIYNWIDEKTFYPREGNQIKKQMEMEDQFVILSVASGWSNKKGLDKIKKIARVISDDMLIVLVGSCEERVTETNIRTLGEIKDVAKLAEIYSMSDVYLNMSLEESFGKVSAEAIMCGTPVIAFDSTANPEIVGKECGYVIKEFDESKILELLKTIKNNTKASYLNACREFGKNNFSKDKNIAKYIELYKKMAPKREDIC